jgi:hypothetical protein
MTPQFRVNEQIYLYIKLDRNSVLIIVIIAKKQVLFKSNTFYSKKQLKPVVWFRKSADENKIILQLLVTVVILKLVQPIFFNITAEFVKWQNFNGHLLSQVMLDEAYMRIKRFPRIRTDC